MYREGVQTQPIPYDASPSMLQHSLQSIYGVGRVRVSMLDIVGDGSAAVCGACLQSFLLSVCPSVRLSVCLSVYLSVSHSLLRTGTSIAQQSTLYFLDFKGERPPMRVSYGDTSNTRQWRDGQTPLSLSSGVPVLSMVSQFVIYCPPCPGGWVGRIRHQDK
jgi:hypothetical protein